MRWRTLLVTLASLLLPLPLALVLGGVLRPSLPTPSLSDKPISPVLSSEQRERLLTYRRDCGSGQPCEPPLGCISELRAQRHLCVDSECTRDAQCPEGQACHIIPTYGGPLVRRCVPVGERQEGEPCYVLGETREDSCAPGLICASIDRKKWCARPCQPGTASACPEGFFCAQTRTEPACLPTCEARAGAPRGSSASGTRRASPSARRFMAPSACGLPALEAVSATCGGFQSAQARCGWSASSAVTKAIPPVAPG